MKSPESSQAENAMLVLRAQLGDRSSLELLLRETELWLLPFLIRAIGTRDRAEDAAQEVLIQIARKLPHLREARAYQSWVYRIASREVTRAVRSEKRHRSTRLGLDHSHSDTAPDAPLLQAEQRAQLLSEISSLPPNSRIACILHYCDGLTIERVSAILAVPVGTVKSRIAYGLALIRARHKENEQT